MIPAAVPAIGRLKTALNNLALAATNNTVVLQQLIAANLALTATITLLTATNKKLIDAATCRGCTPGRLWVGVVLLRRLRRQLRRQLRWQLQQVFMRQGNSAPGTTAGLTVIV